MTTIAQDELELVDELEVITPMRLRPSDDDVSGAIEGGAMTVNLEASKKIPLYNTRDGSVSYIYADWAIGDHLKRRFPDGSRVFSTRKENAPEVPPGRFPCFLNPEFEDYGTVRSLGIAVPACSKKSGFTTEMSREDHASHKHKKQWEAYQLHLNRGRETEERQERLAIAQATLEAVKSIRGMDSRTGKEVELFPCESCDRFFDSKKALDAHQRSH